ncbi:MAG: 8-oxo-dGTP diphosphatase [Candidatus Pacebacteria bacterium]|jgi:8-oxo-dGTP pyrophosphatase MutT (NUDIX family)|nr:8-oxo-dGTP diphosphatase [Candidatus Paceibacterota bacterium]MDD3072778.1 8-oxo-dGTP diphosphatase [Candidatus Paceibacterota bacterium]MDD3729306.1 8-oxo-dGTP diphosphatase [Candidatus Paceibacterota bacterium]MDD4467009.1 8-oxo-dGTP diphosphatase [Candidatus Paceibacterota bacterium]MDD4897646.1 8-oxo-dGTP diphosphatase [Candidatus Paceibacterota bacterium]
MEDLRKATLLFLVKKSKGEVTDICLAMKKRGFGINRYNGVGGKVEEKETIKQAAIREAKEEINVFIKEMEKVAEISFYFPHNFLFNQAVHVYFSENWEGEPRESEEMRPEWFSVEKIPFKKMWPDDIFWLPEVLKGKLLRAMFVFKENDIVKEKEVNIVKSF